MVFENHGILSLKAYQQKHWKMSTEALSGPIVKYANNGCNVKSIFLAT